MKLPRFRLRTLMIAVVVAAANLGLVRAADNPAIDEHLLETAYVLVPSLSLLAVAAASVGVGLATRGQSRSFCTGYLVAGSLASFAMCALLATQQLLEWFNVMEDRIPRGWREYLNNGAGFFVALAIFALPQIAPALVGGGLGTRYGLTMGLGGRSAPRP